MGGTEVAVKWHDRTIRAWLPETLAARDIVVSEPTTVRASERARQTIIAADQQTPPEWEPLARILLRAEGVASSHIEGVHASVPAVALAQLDSAAAGEAAAWVAANLQVIDAAIAHAHRDDPLTPEVLHSWQHTLMAGHTLLAPGQIGAFRIEQGWIGGATPLDAALVTAPPDAIPELVDDLLLYMNQSHADPVAQAAISHAQFEVVHPYADGNGRLGRILILWVLARRIGVRVLPPMSTRIAVETGGYLSGLTMYRLDDADAWIRWFANTLTRASEAVGATMTALGDLGHAWARRLDAAGVRADASARRLITELPRSPVLTSAIAAGLLGVSERSARNALDTLAKVGILAPYDPSGAGRPRVETKTGRPPRWWHAPDVTRLITRS